MHVQSAFGATIAYVAILNQHFVALFPTFYYDAVIVVGLVNALTVVTHQVSAIVCPMEFVFGHAVVGQAIGTLQVVGFQAVEVGTAYDESATGSHAVVAESLVVDSSTHHQVNIALCPRAVVGREYKVCDSLLDLGLYNNELSRIVDCLCEGTRWVNVGEENKIARISGVVLRVGIACHQYHTQ